MIVHRESLGGVHDRTAEVRDLGENSGLEGEDGGPEIAWEL